MKMAYVLNDTQLLDSHRLYFFVTNSLKLLKEKAFELLPKYGRAEAQTTNLAFGQSNE